MTDHGGSQAENDDAPQTSVSRGSSINGPYRQAAPENTFPRCRLVHSITGAEETYSRSLLSSGNGFALWDITGSHLRGASGIEQPDTTPLQGVNIGDVGMIDPHGQFVFGFNIFTSTTHPLHQDHVPEGFEELKPALDRASEVKLTSDHFKPGSIIASKGVAVHKLSDKPLKVSMRSTAREGAVLVLPHGGSREDLISTTRLSDYVNKHALQWYHYMCQHGKSTAETIPNGSLFLITGCDRAKSWSAVAFPSDWTDAGKQIEMTYEGEESPAWLPSRWARENTFGLTEGKNNDFCIFIRGMRISLSNRLWVRELPYNPPEEASYYNVLSSSILGLQSRIARIRERFVRDSDVIWNGHQKFPFHPSMLISQLLLEQHPTADVALIDDSVWLNLAPHEHPTFPEILNWLVGAFMSCEAAKSDKLITLKPKLPLPSREGFLRNLVAKYHDWRTRHRLLWQIKRIVNSNYP